MKGSLRLSIARVRPRWVIRLMVYVECELAGTAGKKRTRIGILVATKIFGDMTIGICLGAMMRAGCVIDHKIAGVG